MGISPTVETVTWRDWSESPAPSSITARAASTAGQLCSGSPMPMKTTWVSSPPRARAWARAPWICAMISPAFRPRVSPSVAVAQNAQPMAQPTWLLTHRV